MNYGHRNLTVLCTIPIVFIVIVFIVDIMYFVLSLAAHALTLICLAITVYNDFTVLCVHVAMTSPSG